MSDRKLCFSWNFMPQKLLLKFFIISNFGSMLLRFTYFSSLCVILFPYSCCLIYATSVTYIQITAYHSVTNTFSTYERLLPAFKTEDQICTSAFFKSVLTQFNCQFLYFDRASRYKFLVITNLTHFFIYLFFSCLYMFRASQRSSSGDRIVLMHHLVWLVCASDWFVQFPPDRHTKQSLTQTNRTRRCINTIRSPDDERCDARNM
jgi:hypothetical protein